MHCSIMLDTLSVGIWSTIQLVNLSNILPFFHQIILKSQRDLLVVGAIWMNCPMEENLLISTIDLTCWSFFRASMQQFFFSHSLELKIHSMFYPENNVFLTSDSFEDGVDKWEHI